MENVGMLSSMELIPKYYVYKISQIICIYGTELG